MLDTVKDRFAFLQPYIVSYGPNDSVKRPAVLLFHACNGVRDFVHDYARQAADLGMRAYVVDSFTPRGWDYLASIALVCTGLALSGHERSGDVLAAIWGIGQRPEVDADNLVLAGWSHGGWAIMDLMTQDMSQSGAARLKDATPDGLKGVKSLFLVYPYISYPARSVSGDWTHAPNTTVVLADRDHLTSTGQATTVLNRLKQNGLPLTTVIVDATHSFDEQGMHFGSWLSYDPKAHRITQDAFHQTLLPFCPVEG